MVKILSRIYRSQPEESGYYVYYLHGEGFYIKRGLSSEIFRKRALPSVSLLEIGNNLDKDFRIEGVFTSLKDATSQIGRSLDLSDKDKPMFRRRKPLVVNKFAGKWELRMRYSKQPDGSYNRTVYPVGRHNPSIERIEYVTFDDPKEVRKNTGNYIPVFCMR